MVNRYFNRVKFWFAIFLMAFGIISIRFGNDALFIIGLHLLFAGIWWYKRFNGWIA